MTFLVISGISRRFRFTSRIVGAMVKGLVEADVWLIMFIVSEVVVLFLGIAGSVELTVLLGPGDARITISNEKAVVFITAIDTSETAVFPHSVEVVISLVVISSAEVPEIKWVKGLIEEVILQVHLKKEWLLR